MLNTVFKTEPLTLPELVTCFALSSIVFIGVELEKWAYRRGWLYSAPTKESAASQQGGDS
jgi:Ca2+-transporting ATPase